jgi:hypothetical protein
MRLVVWVPLENQLWNQAVCRSAIVYRWLEKIKVLLSRFLPTYAIICSWALCAFVQLMLTSPISVSNLEMPCGLSNIWQLLNISRPIMTAIMKWKVVAGVSPRQVELFCCAFHQGAIYCSKESPWNCCGSQPTFKARAVPSSLSLGTNQTSSGVRKGDHVKGSYNGADLSPVLKSYCNADWETDPEDRHSRSGVVCFLGKNLVSWSSRKKSATSVSSCEAEYVSMFEGGRDPVWIRSLLCELRLGPGTIPTQIMQENQGSIAWAEGGLRKVKHVKLKYHHSQYLISIGQFKISCVASAC